MMDGILKGRVVMYERKKAPVEKKHIDIKYYQVSMV